MSLDPDARPEAFAASLREELGGRAWWVRESEDGRGEVSSPRLAPLATWLAAEAPDHEALFLATGPGSGALFAVALHRTARGQAQGGVRRQAYPSAGDAVRDALRLSRAMSRKNALAGLWWGGGKGVIAGAEPIEPERRRALYQEWGAFVTSLRGAYVTAEDAGTSPADIAEIFRSTRFVTCLPPELGGAGNPAPMTAGGVVCAMEAALDVRGLGAIRRRRVVLQGAGEVGRAMIPLLIERGVGEILVGEVRVEACEQLLDDFGGSVLDVRLHDPADTSLLAEPCDVLAPCALGGVLDAKTIPRLATRLVCGSANDPLADECRDAAALAALGITYVPDFVANRMGIVRVADEQFGALERDPALARHLDAEWERGIPQTTRRVLEAADARGTNPLVEALRLADAHVDEPHPIWPGRARGIVESLASGGWASGA